MDKKLNSSKIGLEVVWSSLKAIYIIAFCAPIYAVIAENESISDIGEIIAVIGLGFIAGFISWFLIYPLIIPAVIAGVFVTIHLLQTDQAGLFNIVLSAIALPIFYYSVLLLGFSLTEDLTEIVNTITLLTIGGALTGIFVWLKI